MSFLDALGCAFLTAFSNCLGDMSGATTRMSVSAIACISPNSMTTSTLVSGQTIAPAICSGTVHKAFIDKGVLMSNASPP